MESLETTRHKDQPWEGPQGRRGKDTVATPYTFEETNAWLTSLDLEPMRDGETYVQWSRRTDGGRKRGRVAMNGAMALAEGSQNG